MTRVNLVDPKELTDQHLKAEHLEIGYLIGALRRSLKSKTPIEIPKNFTLGKGHVKFFYNKVLYLQNRHQQLKDEGARRGINLNYQIDWSGLPAWTMNNWTPTEDDKDIVRQRIAEKLAIKPGWYKYYGKVI